MDIVPPYKVKTYQGFLLLSFCFFTEWRLVKKLRTSQSAENGGVFSHKWDISIIPSSQLRHKRSQKDCKSQRGIEPNPRFVSYLVCILCGFPGSGIEELGRKYLLHNAVFDFIILTKQSTCKSNVQIKSLFFTGKGEMKSEQGSKQIEYGKISKFSKFSISLFFALTVDIDLILSYIFLPCLA